MKIVDTGLVPDSRRVLRVDLRTKKQRSNKQSAVIDDLERFDRSSSAAAERLANAVLRGVRKYRKERKADAGSKNAGWSHLPLQAARGMVTSLEEMKGLRKDAEKALSAPRLRKRLKKRLS